MFVIKSLTGVSIRHFSKFPDEDEVLFGANSRFEVERALVSAASEPEKRALLTDLAGYSLAELDVYVLKETPY